MTDVGSTGIFWVASTPDRSSPGVFSRSADRWTLAVENSLFDSARQPGYMTLGDRVWHTFGPDPSADVSDLAPRVIHGQLDDHTSLTLFDAQEMARTVVLPHGDERQRFEGWQVIIGVRLPDLDASAVAVRWTLSTSLPTVATGEAILQEGVLTPHVHEGQAGLCLTFNKTKPLRILADLIPRRISTLIPIALGNSDEPLHREILLPDGSWHSFGMQRTVESAAHSDFVAPQAIGLAALAAWADESGRLGPLPFIAAEAKSSAPLQMQAQTAASALEGLHRRRHGEKRLFSAVSRRALQRSINAAICAGVNQVIAEGWQDAALAETRFRQALGHVGQLTFSERLKALLAPVESVAPGLFGPDLDLWIDRIKIVRNIQSHQLVQHDDFTEPEVALYFVLSQTAAWALRIALLSPILPGQDIRDGLAHSTQFAYTLAHADNEGVWPGFSCLGTFIKS